MNQTNNSLVSLKIDDIPVTVPKGTNLIAAAKSIGISIPHFCYHRHLSIAGNCRICQVKIKGSPKLELACNTAVREGMEVYTHHTSPEVAEAQAAVLEFILINHPMDCTVCDESGRCKLQDYHYKYSAKFSRFNEAKEHKVKALPLGPNVILDGERCILCTRCVRFCDEITKTSELGVLNRGDRSVISVCTGKELTNPLSGTVADLCPVGALTHRPWRFNTRIWFTTQTDTICPGCSTGCNCKVAIRDNQVVQVKGKLNSQVNKGWMCDEGRYGFYRFIPENHLVTDMLSGASAEREKVITSASDVLKKLEQSLLVLLAPDLFLEDYLSIRMFLDKYFPQSTIALSYRKRSLTEVQKILISPDFACNFRGAEFAGLVYGDLEASYDSALNSLRNGSRRKLLIIGERAISRSDLDQPLMEAIKSCDCSVALLADSNNPLNKLCSHVLASKTILESSGMLISNNFRLQYAKALLPMPKACRPEWWFLNALSRRMGQSIFPDEAEKDLTAYWLGTHPRLQTLSLPNVLASGADLSMEASQ